MIVNRLRVLQWASNDTHYYKVAVLVTHHQHLLKLVPDIVHRFHKIHLASTTLVCFRKELTLSHQGGHKSRRPLISPQNRTWTERPPYDKQTPVCLLQIHLQSSMTNTNERWTVSFSGKTVYIVKSNNHSHPPHWWYICTRKLAISCNFLYSFFKMTCHFVEIKNFTLITNKIKTKTN